MLLLLIGGGYYLYKTGKLDEILSKFNQNQKAPAPQPQQQQQRKAQQAAPKVIRRHHPAQAPAPTTGTGTSPAPTTGGGGAGSYPSAGKSCTVTSGGELEDHNGPRREWQIQCGTNFLNTEAIGYFLVPNGSDTISVKLRGPKHSSPTAEKDMCNNIHYFGFGSKKSSAPFGKQAGHTAEYCEFGTPVFPMPDILGKWVGVKAVEYNVGNGVQFESYIDFPEGSGWKLFAKHVDTGGQGTCKGPASQPYLKSPCSTGQVSIGFRIDGSANAQGKKMTAREIAAPGGAAKTTKTAYAKSYYITAPY